jgi:hypothetical protein
VQNLSIRDNRERFVCDTSGTVTMNGVIEPADLHENASAETQLRHALLAIPLAESFILPLVFRSDPHT